MMAIDSNTLCCHTTDSIVLPAKRKFFPTDIPIPHPQLRHFISTAEKDWIYYAAEYDIYCLHIPTKRKRLLTTLPFTPRCLATGQGWICAGGENNGDCAFIKIRRRDASCMDVDSILPLDSGTLNSKTPTSDNDNSTFPDSRQPDMILEQMGGLIVNSITVHALPQEHLEDGLEPIAVISNNDKSVKVFSLLRRQQIAELHHKHCMNYATVSPDSETLVAVGDENRAYFYSRSPKRGQTGFFDGKRFTNYRWQLFSNPLLPSDGRPADDCCFTAAFSPSSHLCAVAAQNGMITVLDMHTLKSLGDEQKPEDAIICTFRSSRPLGFATGAVRSMAFAPEPFDLLLWAEEYGRAGIADVREAFTRRQIINLETHAADMERATLEDLTDSHLRELDPETRMLHQFRETIGLDDDEFESREWLRRGLSRHRIGHIPFSEAREHLTERERHLIESIRTSRPNDQTEASESLLPGPRRAPYSVNYTSSPRVRASLAQADEHRTRSARLRAMLSQFMHSVDADVPDDRAYRPRRRSSVILSQGTTQNTDRLAPSSDTRLRLSTSPSRLSQPDIDLDSAPPGVSTTLEISGAFAPDEPEGERQSNSRAGSRSAGLLALLRMQQNELPDIERRLARQQSELPELEMRILEQQRQLEQLQREMNDRIHSSPRLGASRTPRNEDDEWTEAANNVRAWREMAQALEPFDPSGIPPEEVDAERERYFRRSNVAMEHARRLRHVLFAGEQSSAQTSALPTANVRSSSSSTPDGPTFSTTTSPQRVLNRGFRHRGNENGPSDQEGALIRRPSTPSNAQTSRNRSQSPTSSTSAAGRNAPTFPTNQAPSSSSTPSYAEAVDPRRRQATDALNTSSMRTRLIPTTSNEGFRPPPVSTSLRQARVMAMQNAASRMTDANGNWMAGSALSAGILRGSDGVNAHRENWGERGVGTAGVGWSPDGRHIYIGTEDGIFEYTLNTADRMTFPSFSFR